MSHIPAARWLVPVSARNPASMSAMNNASTYAMTSVGIPVWMEHMLHVDRYVSPTARISVEEIASRKVDEAVRPARCPAWTALEQLPVVVDVHPTARDL